MSSGNKGRRTAAIRLTEVAIDAGVSAMTVSRVLNNVPGVQTKTRQRVEESIQKLGYVPNFMARGLARSATRSIGLLYHNPSQNYLAEVIIGAAQKCRELGHHLILHERMPDLDLLRKSVEKAQRDILNMDAILVLPPLSEDGEFLKHLSARNMPHVLISPAPDTEAKLSVGIDDRAAGRVMTDKIIAYGHKHIGFIRGTPDQKAAAGRFAGFRSSLRDHGIPYNSSWTAQGSFTYRSGMIAAQNILSQSQRPTAIFASNDDMAAGAIAHAWSIGLSVPGDLSVVGFDDTPFSKAIWPSLTTVRQPIARMTGCAIKLLDEQLSGIRHHATPDSPEMDSQNLVLDFEIVLRASLCKPPQSHNRSDESGLKRVTDRTRYDA